MEMLKSIMFTITSMGATAILPLVIFLLGLVFRMKVGAAIKSGITVGIGNGYPNWYHSEPDPGSPETD